MSHVYVFVFNGLADWEIGLVTYELNTRNDLHVLTVGYTCDPITTGGGLTVLPDLALADLNPDDVRALILPGGEMWHVRFDDELASIVLDLHARGIPIAAICGATVFLARAGIIRPGVAHTSNALSYLQEMVPGYAAAADYRDKRAVTDQGIITAGGGAPFELAYHVLKLLGLYDEVVLAEFAEFWGCCDEDR